MNFSFKEWILKAPALKPDIPARFIHGGTVTLFHYTNLPPNRTGNVILHPKKASENIHLYSRNDYQVASFPRLFFYLNPEDVHKDMGVSGNHLYEVEVPVTDIYPMEKDPENIKEKAVTDGRLNFHYYMYLLKEEGYKGGYYNTGLGMGKSHMDIVVLWVPIRATIVPEELAAKRA